MSLLYCWNQLSSASSTSLRSVFRIRLILGPFRSNAPVILVPFLQIVRIVEFMRQKSPTRQSSSLHFIFVFHTLTSPSTLKTFLLLVTVATLSRCQSPSAAAVETRKGTLRTKWITVTIVTVQTWTFCSYLNQWRARFSRTRRWLNSQSSILLGKLHWNRRLAMSYRRFGKTNRSLLQGSRIQEKGTSLSTSRRKSEISPYSTVFGLYIHIKHNTTGRIRSTNTWLLLR